MHSAYVPCPTPFLFADVFQNVFKICLFFSYVTVWYFVRSEKQKIDRMSGKTRLMHFSMNRILMLNEYKGCRH